MTTKQRIIERIKALPDTPETELLLDRFEQKLIELFPEIDFPPRPDAGVMTKARTDTTPAPIVRFTPEQWAERHEREAQREMGISAAEFRRAYAAGELQDGDAAVDHLVHLLIIPYNRNTDRT